MRKPRSDSYEAQLSVTELDTLHQSLQQPNVNLKQLQAQLPAWRSGPHQGEKPTIRTLQNIATRLRAEELLLEMEAAGEILKTAQHQAPSVLNAAPTRFLNQICGLLAQEILEKTVKREDPCVRACLIRLLLRQQEIMVAKMKYQRQTAEDFDRWYREAGPGQQILENQIDADYSERIQSLGRAIFGDDWDPAPSPIQLVTPESSGKDEKAQETSAKASEKTVTA